MMAKGRGIVTEYTIAPAGMLLSLDMWDARGAMLGAIALPGPGRSHAAAGGTILRVGPKRWWLDGAGFDAVEATAALEGRGVVTPNAGGWRRVTLNGDWRDLVMQSGLFDAETPAFGPGSVAMTTLCHAPCVLHVLGEDMCEVFVPASYAGHVLAHWQHCGWRRTDCG